MSDPYEHGETCECDRCMAWSEGFEAGRWVSPPAPVKRLPKLTEVTKLVRSLGGIGHALPPTGTAYLLGLLHGTFNDTISSKHIEALDTVCRLLPLHTGLSASRAIVGYLREHAVADYRPRKKFVRTPEQP